MPYAYINFVNPSEPDPSYGIPEGSGGGYPGHPLPPFPGRPGHPLPPPFPPNIVAPPIYIPPLGWINVPTFPALPIVIPPKPPGSVGKPNFPTNPIVIPPIPDGEIPEGSVLILVVTEEYAVWKMVEKSSTKPIPMPEPK